MKRQQAGWVIINTNHPTGNKDIMFTDCFSLYRSKAIAMFVEGSGYDWKYWRNKFNFRCVKAIQIIETISE